MNVKHPAKLWINKLFWRDRSDEPEVMQVIDLLHDVRLLLLIICLVLAFS